MSEVYKKIEGDVVWRKGMKGVWLELIVKKKDGSEVKLIGKIVKEFLSEEGGGL